jgi:hypothetical protein
MNKINISELSQNDLIKINGGVDEASFNAGYAAGEIVGRSIKIFLTYSGIYKVVKFFL